MSGTSLDGIDVAIVDIGKVAKAGRTIRLVAFHSTPYPEAVRKALFVPAPWGQDVEETVNDVTVEVLGRIAPTTVPADKRRAERRVREGEVYALEYTVIRFGGSTR